MFEKPEVPGGQAGPLIRAESLAGGLPGLLHGFTGEIPGRDLPALAGEVRRLASLAGGRAAPPPVLLAQTHSAGIFALASGAAASPAQPVPGVDGALGSAVAPGLIAVRAADCVPVLAVDGEVGAFAALHAGWRGIAAGIFPALLEALRGMGSGLGRLRVAFGPGIRVCCYEVGPECIAQFPAEQVESAVFTVNGATHLDLVAVLTRQAELQGVSTHQIELLPYCTSCYRSADGGHPFASYRRSRREGTSMASRNAAFIGIVP